MTENAENVLFILFKATTCKRKEDSQPIVSEHTTAPKKPRLVFTDLQRRTLQAIFKVIHTITVIDYCFKIYKTQFLKYYLKLKIQFYNII